MVSASTACGATTFFHVRGFLELVEFSFGKWFSQKKVLLVAMNLFDKLFFDLFRCLAERSMSLLTNL